eukprot:gnl/MRDRNA2_/MRDRNA2_20002_c0_seq1.p1 gnl/MRDRNA2_/MRDRNA2_20002_c0~~gnl/MRDRNA2_/MRDRNA2_20002_c0_seq1.p1  ORF type:complete len:346 (+),score=32.95 gnl/MRDRNA2_/MRDRNA2_20002_c0_seq1:148-1185(+)
MRNIREAILCCFVALSYAKELAAYHSDRLVGNIFKRAFKVLSDANLDSTILAKAYHPSPFLTRSWVLGKSLIRVSQFLDPPPTVPQMFFASYDNMHFAPCSLLPVANALPERPDWIRPQLYKSKAPQFLLPGSVSVAPMREDRFSLFHSLAHGLQALGLDEDGRSVRSRIAEFIIKNPKHCIADQDLKAWIMYDFDGFFETVATYGQALAAGALCGGFIEMSLFCHIWQVDLALYRAVSEGANDADAQIERERSDLYSPLNSVRLKRMLDFASKKKPKGTVLIRFSHRNHRTGQDHYDAIRFQGAPMVPSRRSESSENEQFPLKPVNVSDPSGGIDVIVLKQPRS